MHTGEDGGEIFAAHGDRLDRLGVVNGFERAGAAGADVFQKVRGVAVTPAAERRDVVCELEGGVFLIRLTERRPRGKVLALVLRGEAARGVADLNAGRRAEAEFRIILAQRVHAHAVAHFGEEIVAGIHDRAADVERAVAAALPAVGVARGVAGVRPLAGVVDLFAHGRRAGFERGDGRQRLQGRAGGVFALRGAIPHRLQGVGGELCKVLTERREEIGRIGCERQHIARADLHDGHGRAAVDAVGFCHGRDGIFERLLHLCLKVDVDRQRHGGAGLRLDRVELAGDLAGFVERDKALAVAAVEIVFKRIFHAGDADGARKRVAVLILIIVPVLNAAGVAEDVGGVVGLVNAHGRGIHLHAGIVAILDEGNERNIHVARKFEGRGAVHLGGGEGVAQPDERAHRGIRERFVDPVLAAQLQIQRRACQRSGEAVVADVLFIDPLERDEVFDERFRAAVRGVVGVGRGPGERKRVLNFNALRVHQVDDAQQRVVELVGRDE